VSPVKGAWHPVGRLNAATKRLGDGQRSCYGPPPAGRRPGPGMASPIAARRPPENQQQGASHT